MSDAPRAPRPSILVVDDDVDIREGMADLLEARGYAVFTAANGAAAIELLGDPAVRPALILLDLMMPVLDGYGFLERQRGDARLAGVPVAVISASHAIDHARIGDVPVLRKPIDLPTLLSTIERLQQERAPA